MSTDIPVLALGPTVTRGEISSLRDRLVALLADTGAPHVVIDLSTVDTPDVAVVDALARLKLTARRMGRDIRVRGAEQRLAGLLALLGLLDAVGLELDAVGLGLESHWQVEEREDPVDVEEVVDPDDPAG